ncbi:cytidine deaminase [Myroides ceti]|uniref:Cytidine deaminase n=1 Tax=Paenimyroides ceti TaxID=395087 RepID=A0ABT8CUG1_9FLAO|nr:cytidine deaminase [Paenimyroides ceti]MDN3707786.1 cytidine deaminase [Paenimyroides ceti]
MREIKIDTSFIEYDSLEEMETDVQDLMLRAVEIRKKAYAPYSKFRVGAAILLENNKIILGSNQENAAYPSGLCAERTAVFSAGALFPDVAIKAIAISASSDIKCTDQPIPPCGACRQSLFEYEVKQSQPIAMYCMGSEGKVIKTASITNILPFYFDKNVL